MTKENSAELQDCINKCAMCYQTCLHTTMQYCLQVGGEHAEPAHIKMMLGCAEICRVAEKLQLMNSDYVNEVCQLCAKVCEDCAAACNEMHGMENCMLACKECAESCYNMIATK